MLFATYLGLFLGSTLVVIESCPTTCPAPPRPPLCDPPSPPPECPTPPPSTPNLTEVFRTQNCAFISAKRPKATPSGIPRSVLNSYFDACKSGDLTKVETTINTHPMIINLADLRIYGLLGDRRATCLEWSIINRTRNIFDHLMSRSTLDVHVTNNADHPVLINAAAWPHNGLHMIEKILDKAPEMLNRMSAFFHSNGQCWVTKNSRNALDYAIANNHKAAADLLKQRGAKCYCYKTKDCGLHNHSQGLGHTYCPDGVVTFPFRYLAAF